MLLPRSRASSALVTALFVLALGAAGLPAEEPNEAESRAKRRTPVVEIFETWKDSVVFVTGPMVKSEKPTTEEFFNPPPQKPHENSVGTGYVLHESGYIVTNAHAAEKLISPLVVLADNKAHPAEVLAVVHPLDLALLKVEAGQPLKPVRLARSGDVMIGETIVVIGNPHGLLRTCTTGVVSAIGRVSHLADLPGVTLQDLIQSDAGINPGSSGGPWFNVIGEVMATTASMKRDAENIAFGISAGTLRKALPGMLDVERRHGFATGMEVAADGPSQILAVQPNSTAAKAGLRDGDVLIRVAGKPVPTSADYHLALIGRRAGETLSLDLLRDGKPQQASLVLAPRPSPDGAAILRQKTGITAAPLEESRAKAMGLRVSRGVLVTAVDPKLYEKLPHRPEPGDVLARVNWIRPRDLNQIGMILEKAVPGQEIKMVLLRQKDGTTMRLDMNLALRP